MSEVKRDFRKDCPKCEGDGGYTMTNSDTGITCTCDLYDDEEWEQIKKEWNSN